ncbi:hypothetical protein [Carp edema virus]|nr:hypothetical protein [Carp edema virus]
MTTEVINFLCVGYSDEFNENDEDYEVTKELQDITLFGKYHQFPNNASFNMILANSDLFWEKDSLHNIVYAAQFKTWYKTLPFTPSLEGKELILMDIYKSRIIFHICSKTDPNQFRLRQGLILYKGRDSCVEETFKSKRLQAKFRAYNPPERSFLKLESIVLKSENDLFDDYFRNGLDPNVKREKGIRIWLHNMAVFYGMKPMSEVTQD